MHGTFPDYPANLLIFAIQMSAHRPNRFQLEHLLPSPFTIALLLSGLAWWMALFFTRPADASTLQYAHRLLGFWELGFWELLDFSMQMMLILILGHVLARSKAANIVISSLVRLAKSGPGAVMLVCSVSLLAGLLNWGLGLVFGAILARKMAAHAKTAGFALNYPLLAAAAYACMLVWHGGLSGSAPLKVAEPGHFLATQIGVIPVTETLFSTLNISVCLSALLVLPLFLRLVARITGGRPYTLPTPPPDPPRLLPIGAEKLDHLPWLGISFGLLLLVTALLKPLRSDSNFFQLLNLNYINFILFGLGLIAHGSIHKFLQAVNEAMVDGAGILVQFPLYAGIMGIVKYSGLMALLTQQLLDLSTPESFPIITLISAGIVNIFVPSGGGQWIVQGPIVTEAALRLGVSIPKTILALAYGDQLTNMLQPFWALPLLAITGLKAREILPYTLLLLLAGFIIFATLLWVF